MNRKRINNNNIILNHASLSHYKEFLIMHALRNNSTVTSVTHKFAYIITVFEVCLSLCENLQFSEDYFTADGHVRVVCI